MYLYHAQELSVNWKSVYEPLIRAHVQNVEKSIDQRIRFVLSRGQAHASRLLAKAGVKISPDDLHDRASSANSLNISGGEYGYNNQQDIDNCEKNDQFDDNLKINSSDDNKQTSLLNLEHANASISQMRNDAAIAAAVALNQKELSSEQSTTNQPLLDLQLLQF
ncbi:unnamed protein product [Ceratitis capitata]|uniref:(Mediterranean fruit fly) hypothetical protein n=1 Tax=Ceratitis capitata TaxID=7213 RepID=A0A811UCJ5_CERCA|nr:unnamed protein product [Ceratitis capitata]